jgi:hypothetical protein
MRTMEETVGRHLKPVTAFCSSFLRLLPSVMLLSRAIQCFSVFHEFAVRRERFISRVNLLSSCIVIVTSPCCSLLLSLVVLSSLCVFLASIFVPSAHRSRFVPRFDLFISLSLMLQLFFVDVSCSRHPTLASRPRMASLPHFRRIEAAFSLTHTLHLRVCSVCSASPNRQEEETVRTICTKEDAKKLPLAIFRPRPLLLRRRETHETDTATATH